MWVVTDGNHVSLVTLGFMTSGMNWKKSLFACACISTVRSGEENIPGWLTLVTLMERDR